MKRRYTNVRDAGSVYVDSLGHYHLFVWYDDTTTGKRHKREYCWDLLNPLGVGAPAYLERACERLLLATLKDPTTRYYEYDRDGNKRYEGLRYFEPSDVVAIIGALERRRLAK